MERLSDKQTYYVHKLALEINQVCLYNSTPDSILYQEMLAYKAIQTLDIANARNVSPGDEDDDSGWEFLSGDHYDGGSEISASSYFSDQEQSPAPDSPFSSPPPPRNTSDKALDLTSDDEVAVGYFTKKHSYPEAGSIQVMSYPMKSREAGQMSGGVGSSVRDDSVGLKGPPLEKKEVRFEMKTFARDSDSGTYVGVSSFSVIMEGSVWPHRVCVCQGL